MLQVKFGNAYFRRKKKLMGLSCILFPQKQTISIQLEFLTGIYTVISLGISY
jgi:hypothetical protein